MSAAFATIFAFSYLTPDHARAHCQTAFATTAPRTSFRFHQQATYSDRVNAQAFHQRFEAKTGIPFAAATASQILAQHDALIASFSNSNRKQVRLLFEVEYLAALYNEGQSRAVLERINRLRIDGLLLTKGPAQWAFDDGDMTSSFNLDVLQAFILLLERHARLSQYTLFTNDYVEALASLLELAAAADADYTSPLLDLAGLLPDIDPRAFRPAADFARAQTAARRWIRMNNIMAFEKLLAVDDSESDDTVDLYIDADGIKILRFSIDGGSGGTPPTILSGGSCHHNYVGHLFEVAKKRETDDFVLASVVKNEAGQYAILTTHEYPFLVQRNHFMVESSAVDAMSAGEIPSDAVKELSAFMNYLRAHGQALILTEHPLMQKSGVQLDANQAFVHALQRAYPDNQIAIDAPSGQLSTYVKRLKQQTVSPSDLAVVLDVKDFSVDLQENFFEKAPAWQSTLGVAGIIYYTADTPAIKNSPRNVIVITGRTNEDLRRFVRELGDKGFINNNFVVLESCGEPLSASLVAEINERYNAAATFHYRGRINPLDALDHADAIINSVQAQNGVSFARTVVDRLRELLPSVRRPAEGFWTICESSIVGFDHG
jgi:hypothetical protein